MSKDAYYFSHDSNAKDDPKCVMLIEQLGLEGYGIFWVLIETLREQPTYKYPMVLLPALARRFNTTADKMKAVVCGYGLFEVDEKEFFSLSLMERMKRLDAKREQAREAVNRRWEKQKSLPSPKEDLCVSNTDVLREYNVSNTSKVKESKVKESKVNYKEQLLEILKGVANYPFDEKKDNEMIDRLQASYPTIEFYSALQDWAVYKLDNPLEEKSNARSQINTSFQNCIKWNKHIKQPESKQKYLTSDDYDKMVKEADIFVRPN